jgi:peptidoglycan/xylan/chitin deacetylase (PgdA/CDA1 family)
MNAAAPAAVSLPFLIRGSRETKKVAFTFDDGPTPGVTEMVLDALKKHNIKATFFMIGQRVKERPDMARRVRDEGHELANHSYTHPALGKLGADRVKSELNRCQEVIHEATGVTPTWFRPPYGSFRQSQGPLAVAERLNVVIWSVDPRDWSRPGVGAIQNRVIQGTGNGDIILCHDLHKQTGQAADAMIAGVLQRGFEPVKLGDLLLG